MSIICFSDISNFYSKDEISASGSLFHDNKALREIKNSKSLLCEFVFGSASGISLKTPSNFIIPEREKGRSASILSKEIS